LLLQIQAFLYKISRTRCILLPRKVRCASRHLQASPSKMGGYQAVWARLWKGQRSGAPPGISRQAPAKMGGYQALWARPWQGAKVRCASSILRQAPPGRGGERGGGGVRARQSAPAGDKGGKGGNARQAWGDARKTRTHTHTHTA